MRRRLRHLVPLLFALVVVAASCSDDDDASDQVVDSSTTTSTSSSSTTTSTTTTTAPFEGATTPTSIAASAGIGLLTDVTVEATKVTFTFRDGALPGIDAAYVDEVTADASGEPVAVEGEAHLQIRMEPASGVDLSSSSGSFEETYTGPDRIAGPSPIVEAVQTGDFEANLTWVIGVVDERPYRVDLEGSTVVVSVAP